ncbi:MAG TPA: ABC transporter substrate-binding protein [Solirubrobacterales bacterium]|nr:ABC transporter substrate-binding protein [Solirubrobacterales bacterium]
MGHFSKLFGHGEEPRRGRALVLVAALALIAALVLSACGGGSSSSSSSESTGASEESTEASSETSGGEEGGGEASGEPIPIMALGTFEATVAYPEGPPAFEAQVEKINKEGGVNGSELELTICNDQGNPQVASHCAQEAVEKHDVAVMGSYSVQAAAFIPILESAHIPYIGADATQSIESTSEISFPIENQYGLYGSMGYAAGTKGCKKAGIITENYGAATASEDEAAAKAFEGSPDGETMVKRIEVGSTTTDYAPPIATLLSAGAECIISPLPPEELPKMISAIKQSSDPEAQVAVTAASLPIEELEALGTQGEGMLVGSAGYVPGAEGAPAEVTEALKMVEEFEPSAEHNTFTLAAIAAVRIVAHVAEEAGGEVTAESMLKGMGELNEFETGVAPPYTTTKEGPLPGKPRLFNLQVLAYEVQAGSKQVPITKKFVDLGPIIGG